MLEIEGFPEQCGIQVITGFSPRFDHYTGKYAATDAEAVKEKLATIRHEDQTDDCYGEDSDDDGCGCQKSGMAFATYNDEQLRADPALPATLEAAGMRCLSTFKNPNTENQVWVWYKLLVKPLKRPRRSKRRRASKG